MARITHYDQGDAWVPQATFSVNGTPTDPTTITVKVKEPDGTISTMGPVSGGSGGSGITRVSDGVYTVTIALDAAGYWFAQFIGTGTAAGSEEHQAIVDPSEFTSDAGIGTRALVSLSETRDWLRGQGFAQIDTVDDLELVRVINDMSERAHDESEREFKPQATNPAARTFDVDARALRQRIVDVGDVSAVTLVEILDTDWSTVVETVAASDYSLQPQVRKAWEPYRRIAFSSDVTPIRSGMRVRVTGTWGFPSVPGSVRQAVLDAVAAVMDRDVEHYRQDLSPAPQAPEGGTLIMVGGGRQRFVSMPPASLAVLWGFRDPVIG
jgi:hypothetical protein